MSIGERIKRLRVQLGMTQKDLAEASGLSVITIQNIERGSSTPRTPNLQRIADALDVQIWDLIPGPDPSEVSTYENFEAYMKSIGFSVYHRVTKYHYEVLDDQPEPFRVPDETECILSKDGHTVTLPEDEFIDLTDRTEDYIEGWFYKKAADQQK